MTQAFSSFTKREQQILDLVRSGLTSKAVARELMISPRTVEVHRASLMRKVGAKNFAHLSYLLESGMAQSDTARAA